MALTVLCTSSLLYFSGLLRLFSISNVVSCMVRQSDFAFQPVSGWHACRFPVKLTMLGHVQMQSALDVLPRGETLF